MSDFFDTIQDLHVGLTELNKPLALVFIDGKAPTALSSYRGDYSELAIERNDADWVERQIDTKLDEPGAGFDLNMAGYGHYQPGHRAVEIKFQPTVGELIKALGLAVGKSFEGYKGGQFTMHESTDLWVSEYGESNRRRILRRFNLESADVVDMISLEIPY